MMRQLLEIFPSKRPFLQLEFPIASHNALLHSQPPYLNSNQINSLFIDSSSEGWASFPAKPLEWALPDHHLETCLPRHCEHIHSPIPARSTRNFSSTEFTKKYSNTPDNSAGHAFRVNKSSRVSAVIGSPLTRFIIELTH